MKMKKEKNIEQRAKNKEQREGWKAEAGSWKLEDGRKLQCSVTVYSEQSQCSVAAGNLQPGTCNPEKTSVALRVRLRELCGKKERDLTTEIHRETTENAEKRKTRDSRLATRDYKIENSTVKINNKLLQRQGCIYENSFPVTSKAGNEKEGLAFRACELLLN